MAFPDPKSGSGLCSNVHRKFLSQVAAFYLVAENVFARLGQVLSHRSTFLLYRDNSETSAETSVASAEN